MNHEFASTPTRILLIVCSLFTGFAATASADTEVVSEAAKGLKMRSIGPAFMGGRMPGPAALNSEPGAASNPAEPVASGTGSGAASP